MRQKNQLKKLALATAITVSFSASAQQTYLFDRQLSFENEVSNLSQSSITEPSQTRQKLILDSIKLNSALGASLQVGNSLSLTIDGQFVQIQLQEVTVHNSKTTYINGRSSDGHAKLSMIKTNNSYSAKIYIGNTGYLLTPSGNGFYKLSKFTQDNTPIDSTSDRPDLEQGDSSHGLVGHTEVSPFLRAASNNAANAATEVTVVVAYTDKLAAEVGDVDAYIALMEKDTNDSYAASGINASVRVLHSYQTGYVSTGDMSEDNSLLLNENTSSWLAEPNPLAPNGFGVELKSIRDAHQADIMVFLADQNASSPWAGWAGQIGTDAESALFTMSSWGTFKNTFGHELGHLYGARHDNDSTTTPFAFGHGFCNDSKTWRTLMAISDCGERLNVWSNPNRTYQGEAGGTVEVNDNARVHNERAAFMAALRTPDHNAPTAAITQATITPGSLTANFSGQANDSDGIIVSTLWDFGDGVYNNKPYAQGDSVTHTYLFPGTYIVRYTATDNEGLIHSTSQQVTITSTPGQSYCGVKGTNAVYQYTQSVSVNGKAHQSDRRQYTDHTALDPFTVYAGSATGIELQQGTRGSKFGPYSAYWAVYVDLNQNNSFEDPGELIHFSEPLSKSSPEPILASITIPDSALAGITRMRVIQSNTLREGETQLAACGDFKFGEAEDYSINVIKEHNPAEFTTSINNSDLNVAFSIDSGDVASVKWDFGDGLFSDSSTSTSFNPSHQYFFAGEYTVTLTVTLKNGETYTQTKVITVTAPAGQDYCRAYGNQPKYQYNANVTLNGNSVTSGSAHYTNHTDKVLGAVKGDNILSVRQGATGSKTSYNAEWRVYIDMNQNGTFEDSESVWYWVGANTANDIERTISIPASALTGKARMRVLQSYEELKSPCGRIRWGEVEDFTVDIQSDNPADFTPNVTANNLTVNFADSLENNPDIASIEYDFGDSVVNQNHTSTQGNPSHTYLYAGTYSVRLKVTLQNGVSYMKEQDVTVSGPAHCIAYAKSTTQWTSNVRVGSLRNSSKKSQFSRFEKTGFSFKKNAMTNIGLTHGSNGPYLANWAVYLDLNQNNSFDDSGELLLQTSATTFDEVVNSVTIPASAKSGSTTMRIIQSYELADGKLPACGSYGWGEVEDYSVTITDEQGPESDLLNGATKSGISIAAKETKTFTFFVPEGAKNIKVEMGAGTGDPDLYVKFGDSDTATNWDCRPYTSGNRDETCDSSKLTKSGGIYYVSVVGWTASNNVTLTGSFTEGDVIEPPINACATKAPQTRGNLSNNDAICMGSNTVYVAISVPAGQSKLTITTAGGDGDASIYQNAAGWPSASNFQHSATTQGSSEELIVINNPASGWHYLMVSGQGTGAQLNAKFE
ncbi:GEVED domain-containing protein [Pseudoalteromonas sp. SMS1]|uniref:GEVED domain-containing protein n=1 Tax=Pseudoalteromonas sp. SMS1 TaxID=2908894 RepID=UPI001F3151CC|nr:GEVED domain-containing protein [Pseudoalteromonas sp. SMS1]MCF2858186.1 GEVED domain-containing protein [Pseudoalteromonas sp. SMS1]